MSAGWSYFVIGLVLLNLLGCLWLLWWTGKRRPGDPKPSDISHYWDGDLTEYNQPMPRWWINMFYLTIAFAAGYLIYYPGLGAFQGTSQWSSAKQHASDAEQARKAAELALKPYKDASVAQLSANSQAIEKGRALFLNYCTTCHGSAAKGARGFPNLTDLSWQWGGAPDEILASIQNGRLAAMPAWGDALGGASGVRDVAAYVRSLGTDKPLSEGAGKQHFETLCIACHGLEGKGNPLLGAPDLTDAYWLYGNSDEALAESISQGRNGTMPAHLELLGETRTKLLAAYVASLSQAPGAVGADAKP